ncbi:YceD family protein [Parendozoicomonas sp. Alg238-R29]|uniref:YceD family protein n=1 Tax=Parendozoicomonas sp. Alg238-R29 TaxID=2993446 RepID=UPI00248F0404|nr:YceD family protein [Parendozoicomonas sp. Alg238-R29]
MFIGQLPKHVSPRKLAYQNAKLEGELAVASCPRLKDILVDDRASLQVTLKFDVDHQRRAVVQCEMQGTLLMVCQRCLDVAEIQFAACVNMAVVRNEEQARNLPADLDPLFVVEDESVELMPLLEQEVLLGLPAFAYHENETCHSGQEAYSTLPEGGAEELDVEDVQRPNPFSVLAGLKTGE